MPIYIGDDLTDEDGFRVIEKYGKGVTVCVGELNSTSTARYFLKSQGEVYYFLVKLLDFERRGFLREQCLNT